MDRIKDMGKLSAFCIIYMLKLYALTLPYAFVSLMLVGFRFRSGKESKFLLPSKISTRNCPAIPMSTSPVMVVCRTMDTWNDGPSRES
jgi:hypothetical protein